MRRLFAPLTRVSVTILLVLGAALVSTSAATAAAEPLRVMLVGDSITHGSAGDWTWRYRLWKEFQSQAVPVDFVGPRNDLFDNVTSEHGSQAYLDADFDRDHAAVWGGQLTFPSHFPTQLTEDYQPDVVVILIGVNDLTWMQQAPTVVQGQIRDMVARIRAVDPDVEVVLGQTPLTWKTGVPALNDLLDELGDELPDAAVADTDTDFTMDLDTWDGTHPSATGEVKIAAAVADAIAELGHLAPVSRPLPEMVNGPRSRPVLSVVEGYGAPRLSWTLPPGSQDGRLWGRTEGGEWSDLGVHRGNREVPLASLDPALVEFRVQPIKGVLSAADDMFSAVVRRPVATPVVPTTPPTTAPPKPAPRPPATATPPPPRVLPKSAAPRSVKVRKDGRRAVVSWRRETTATRYRIRVRVGTGAWRHAGWSTSIRWKTQKLVRGKRYAVRVQSYRGSSAGQVSAPVTFRG